MERQFSDEAYVRRSKTWAGRVLVWVTIFNVLVIGGLAIWFYLDPLVTGSILVLGFGWMIPVLTIFINLILGLIWLLGKFWPDLHKPNAVYEITIKGYDVMKEQAKR